MDVLKTINYVEGLDPSKLVLPIDGKEDEFYLHFAEREIWFRLRHPNGKIKQDLIKIENLTVLAKSAVYADANDPEENFLAQGYGAYTDSELPENKIPLGRQIEIACSRATSRALKGAGFSTQSALGETYNPDGDGDDTTPTDKSVNKSSDKGNNPKVTKAAETPKSTEASKATENPITTDTKGQETVNDNESVSKAICKESNSADGFKEGQIDSEIATDSEIPNMAAITVESTSVIEEQGALNVEFAKINAKTTDIITCSKTEKTYEEWQESLTQKEAGEMIITCIKSEEKGNGKTMSWLAINRPKVLDWLVNKSKYESNHPKEVAAGKILYDAAKALEDMAS